MMNPLLQLYKKILESMDCIVDSEGNIFSVNGEVQKPIVIEVGGKTKNLVLPTEEKRKKWDNESWIAFHPACETVFKGQSEVINLLSNLAAVKLFKATQIGVIHLLSLAADKNKHNALSRLKLKTLVAELPDVSENTLQYLKQIINKTTGVYGTRPIMGLKFSVAPTINGNKFHKSCKLLTPILQEKDPIYDLKAGNNSQRAVKRAYELMFPEVKEFGTNSEYTPYMDSLLGMFYTASTHLNEIKDVMGKHGSGMNVIDVTWYEDSKNARKYMQQFLNTTFPGNTGTTNDERVATKQEIKVTAEMPKSSSPNPTPIAAIPATIQNIQAPPAAPPMPTYSPPAPMQPMSQPMNASPSGAPNIDMVNRLRTSGMPGGVMPGTMPGVMPGVMAGYPPMPPGYPQMNPNYLSMPGSYPMQPIMNSGYPSMPVSYPPVNPTGIVTRGHLYGR